MDEDSAYLWRVTDGVVDQPKTLMDQSKNIDKSVENECIG